MLEIGRLYIKIAGRDAGKTACVVDIIDDNYVLIDGAVRRRKCNIAHLEPLDKMIKIQKGASHETIKSEFSKLKIEVKDTKSKPKTERPKKQRKKKEKAAEIEKPTAEKKAKKAEPKKEDKKPAEPKKQAEKKE